MELARGEPMGRAELENALRDASEVEITVTGRRSGRQITIPVWFVEEGETLYLLPVRGSDADWYRNLVANPTIRLTADGAEHTAKVAPTTDPGKVHEVVDKFSAKYGAKDVEDYYTKQDAAVEIPPG
jgi:deazaflavin-dependent oxidoreductase (nitroreductase family)